VKNIYIWEHPFIIFERSIVLVLENIGLFGEDFYFGGDFVFLDPPYFEQHDYQFNYNIDEKIDLNFLYQLLNEVMKLVCIVNYPKL
jgi:hypothetical protein